MHNYFRLDILNEKQTEVITYATVSIMGVQERTEHFSAGAGKTERDIEEHASADGEREKQSDADANGHNFRSTSY